MGKIVAIGGGENGRPGYEYETAQIDEEIIRLTGKTSPVVLFIPTASSDSEGYIQCMRSIFEDRFGCKLTTLELAQKKYTLKEIENTVFSSDIVYVGGGNTKFMIEKWKECNLDNVLKEAHNKGVVLSGVSAGSICWFKYENSDSLRFEDGSTQMIKVEGLNIINALHCPHYDKEENRKESLKQMMKETKDVVGIALDNCAALEVVDNKYRIISSKDSANGYKVYWRDSQYHEDLIEKDTDYKGIIELLKY